MTGPDRPVGEDDLTAHVDDRLTSDRKAAVEAFLAGRPALAARIEEDRGWRETLRHRLRFKADEPIPTRLRIGAIRAARRRSGRRVVGWSLAASLLLALGGTAGWFARDLVGGGSASRVAWAAMAGDALAAHRTFAVEIVHPVEVKASEETHLGQWLSKRLRRRLVIPDLEERFGLALVGGRLLPAASGDVAALLMYADATGSRLTVYVRSGERGETALKFLREGELASFSWVDEGYGYVVAAAMERERLQSVARAISQDVDMDAAKSRKAL